MSSKSSSTPPGRFTITVFIDPDEEFQGSFIRANLGEIFPENVEELSFVIFPRTRIILGGCQFYLFTPEDSAEQILYMYADAAYCYGIVVDATLANTILPDDMQIEGELSLQKHAPEINVLLGLVQKFNNRLLINLNLVHFFDIMLWRLYLLLGTGFFNQYKVLRGVVSQGLR